MFFESVFSSTSRKTLNPSQQSQQMVRGHIKVAARRFCQSPLMIAIIRAWDAPFKGDTADVLLATTPMHSTSKKEGDFMPTL
jgi:hypothetical protein